MQWSLLILASLLMLGSAQGGEVFVTKDAKGNTVYTDRPESLPARKVNVATNRSADQAEEAAPTDDATQPGPENAKADAATRTVESKQARELMDADKAKHCVDARARDQQVMTARRIYESGANENDRRYLDPKEVDAARASAKQAMDEFCAGQ